MSEKPTCSIIRDLENILELELRHRRETGLGLSHVKQAANNLVAAINNESLHTPKNGATVIMGEKRWTLRFCKKCGVELKSNSRDQERP